MTADAPRASLRTGIVAIGRNEGQRFRDCLHALPADVPVVYVDSGSTDDSVAFARSKGVAVVELPSFPGFTAARARNAGFARLMADHGELFAVQFIDGDCVLDADWLAKALSVLDATPELAVVFGRRRERYPEASIYNAQCDREWNVPVGDVRACGGDALMRVEAFHAVGGYDDDLIAGEEPDLCLRMRARGWLIRRIDAEMTLHDANILSFAGWWRRAKRAGHAYAEHVWRNRGGSDPDWVRQMRSMFFWAVLLPLCFAAGLLCAPSGLVVSAGVGGLVILQYIRMARRSVAAGESGYYARRDAALMLAAKFAHLAGSLAFWVNRLRRKRSEIIEYK